jgi:hypothetical protein
MTQTTYNPLPQTGDRQTGHPPLVEGHLRREAEIVVVEGEK